MWITEKKWGKKRHIKLQFRIFALIVKVELSLFLLLFDHCQVLAALGTMDQLMKRKHLHLHPLKHTQLSNSSVKPCMLFQFFRRPHCERTYEGFKLKQWRLCLMLFTMCQWRNWACSKETFQSNPKRLKITSFHADVTDDCNQLIILKKED